MRTCILAVMLLAGVWCRAGASPPLAMEKPGVKGGKPVATPATAPATFNLSFRGGTLKNLLEQVERAAGKKQNVICSEEAAGCRIPEFNLADTNLERVLTAVAKIAPEVLVEKDAGGNFIVILRQREEMRYRFYQLKKHLGKYTLEQVNALVQASWELVAEEERRSDRPKIRFHEETGIMIVAGTRKQLEAVDALLEELDDEAEGKTKLATSGKTNPAGTDVATDGSEP